MSKPKILIGMPTPGMVFSETCDSMHEMQAELASRGIEALVMRTEGVYVFRQRNIIVQKALELGCTHVMFFDNDMVFPANIVSRFLNYDKDIISTNYVVKRKRGKCTFSCTDENFKTIKLNENDVGLKKVYIAPTGTMLIKMSVFLKIAYPWFMHAAIKTDKIDDILGEDSYFCHEAHKAGLEVFVDCDMSKQIEHIGLRSFNWKDAE